MLHIYPDYYEKFHCLAGSCPDSCCAAGWQIVVDDETAARYRAIPGEFGAALNGAMATDADGDRVIDSANGKCPFWTAAGLCRIELELGHDAPCHTCRKFPRITQDYGDRIEYGLTLGCPEAARLILTGSAPWKLNCRKDDTPGEAVFFDQEDFQFLLDSRQILLDELWQETSPGAAIRRLLLHSQWFQQKLDGEAPPPWEQVLSRFQPEHSAGSVTRQLLSIHRELDILNPQWQRLLDAALAFPAPIPPVAAGQMGHRLAADYLYRYWPQAVNDWDCVSRMYLLAVNWLVVTALAGVHLARWGGEPTEVLLRLFCQYAREVEHDDENREAVLDALYKTISPESLLGSL